MKIDVTVPIRNYNGKPFKADEDKDLTLRDVLINALAIPHKDDEKLTADKKIHRDMLAREIYAHDKPNIPTEDFKELQELINRTYPQPSIVAQAFALLDPDSAKKPAEDKPEKDPKVENIKKEAV